MPKAATIMPSSEYLYECLIPDFGTGRLVWRWRPNHHFGRRVRDAAWVAMMWNHGNAGREAGSSCTGRIRLAIDGQPYARYRVLWKMAYGEEPPAQIDHINGIKTDDRLCNLRAADNAQNNRNRPAQGNNTSGFKGVSKKRRQWRARISVNGTEHSLGTFDTPEAAAAAYREAAERLHGAFARTE